MRAFRAQGSLQDKVTFQLGLKICMGDNMSKGPSPHKSKRQVLRMGK